MPLSTFTSTVVHYTLEVCLLMCFPYILSLHNILVLNIVLLLQYITLLVTLQIAFCIAGSIEHVYTSLFFYLVL